MKMSPVRLTLILVFLTILGGCSIFRGHHNDAPPIPPGRLIAISLFKCNCDPVVQEAIQDSLIGVFFTETNAKPIKGENADITIVGIITMDGGQTGSSEGKVLGIGSSIGGRTSGSSASGNYVTGITIQAYKNGELIATNSVGQDLGKGTLISPVTFAQDAVWQIVKALVRQNEIGYK
jgi:hypothetical protein